MIKIGITGGIGSGKSVVAEIFSLCGIPRFDADREAKQLNDSSAYIRHKLSRLFGNDLYRDGKLDRKKLASAIFGDQDKLSAVNNIIHPIVARHFEEWCRQHDDARAVVIDAALLVEAGFVPLVDQVVVVTAPDETRVQRVMRRDGATRQEVLRRIKSQMPEEEKIRHANHIIVNNGQESLLRQVAPLILDIGCR